MDDDIDLEKIKELDERHPVRRYVNLLLLDMARRGGDSITLRESETLPAPAGASLEGVDFPHVLNRLKIMSGLSPVMAKAPVGGKIELIVNGASFTAHAHFDDRAADRFCELRLEKGNL